MRCILFILLFSGQVLAADLTMMVGENPPFNSIRDGKPRGIAVDIVDEMLRRAALSADYPSNHSWSRSFNMAQNQKNHCIYLIDRIPEREALFTWIGPVAYSQWTLFALKKRKISLNKLEDAKKFTLAGQLRDAQSTWLAARGFKIDYSISEKQSLQKLLAERVDLYPGALLTIDEIARDNQLDIGAVEPVLVFNKTEAFIGCSRASDEKIIGRLKTALESMKADKKSNTAWSFYQKQSNASNAVKIDPDVKNP